MDESLLPPQNGESSNPAGNFLDFNDSLSSLSMILGRETNFLFAGNKFEQAAALVDKAMNKFQVITKNGEFLYDHKQKLLFLFSQLEFVWHFNLFLLLLLNFFEVPLWCKNDFPSPCGDTTVYLLSGMPYLNWKYSLIIEIITALILCIQTFFPLYIEGKLTYFKKKLHIAKTILFILLLIDITYFSIFVFGIVSLTYLNFRFAPYIRIFFCLVNNRKLRRNLKLVIGVIPDFFNVGSLLCIFVLYFSWVAFLIFQGTDEGDEYFYSFGNTLYQMFILLTTDNNPDVWMPAYRSSRFTCLFFIIYLLIGVYFLLNLVFAVVFNSFKDQLIRRYHFDVISQKKTLTIAFQILDDQNRGFIEFNELEQVIEKLNTFRIIPIINLKESVSVFNELDDSHDGKIDMEEFQDLCIALSLHYVQAEAIHSFQRIAPDFYNSNFFQSTKSYIKSKHFQHIIFFILILNMAVIFIETMLISNESSTKNIFLLLEELIGLLFGIEMILKIFFLGFINYWRDIINKFSCIITLFSIGGLVAVLIEKDLGKKWIRYVLIAQLLRLTQLLVEIKIYEKIVKPFFTLIPVLVQFSLILFFNFCFFCTMGVQLFGGLIYEGNTALDGTSFSSGDYYTSNFNDYFSGMVVLFNLNIVNNWDILSDAFVAVTGTWFTRLYFIAFFFFAVVFLLNLVAAFIVDAFLTESDILKSNSQIEKLTEQNNTLKEINLNNLDQIEKLTEQNNTLKNVNWSNLMRR